jgi:uncharacterized protein involved in exopolysaccharide biosynthesis
MRYGAEFDALLDDAGLQWRDLADVIRGAVIMRMATWMSYWKMAALAGIAGAMLAAGVSFAIPNRYVATAALQIEPNQDAQGTVGYGSHQLQQGLEQRQRLEELKLEILSRDNLMPLVQRLDLYRGRRSRVPVEDIAEEMVRKHLRIIPFSAQVGSVGQAFRISFEYPDRFKARAVVVELISQFQSKSLQLRQDQRLGWIIESGTVLRILEAPLTPVTPISPARGSIAVAGAMAGMVMGSLFVTVWRRTRKHAVLNISLPDEIRPFVASRIGPGGYRSASEYIRVLIREDEKRKSGSHS